MDIYFNKIFLLCLVVDFSFCITNIGVWADLLEKENIPFLVCLSRSSNQNDKDKDKCKQINDAIGTLISSLKRCEEERKQAKAPLQDVVLLSDCKESERLEFEKYYMELRQNCYKYQGIENAHNNVRNLWQNAFRYHWIIDLWGLSSRIRTTSFEEYMNWIAKEDAQNKIAQEKIKSYFG